jgi:lipopolysaccharide heptosyltransferase II
MIDRLRRGAFDAAVVFTVYSQSALPAALLCFLADIPLRLAHCRENPYQLLTDWVPDPEPARRVRHEVRRHLDLVGAIGCAAADERLRIRVTPAAAARAERLVAALGVTDGSWVIVHPGSTAPSRRYPPESFACAARSLAREDGLAVVFTGTADEAALIDDIREAMGAPSASLAGQLSVEDLAAVLSRAPLLISNNTGPVHVAAAVGTPVVDLYALTNPQHTPWGVPSRVLSHDVPCKYCYKSICPEGHHACLRQVRPEAVVAAARELLSRTFAARDGTARAPACVREGLGAAQGDVHRVV